MVCRSCSPCSCCSACFFGQLGFCSKQGGPYQHRGQSQKDDDHAHVETTQKPNGCRAHRMPGGSKPAPSARRRPRPRAAQTNAVTVPTRSPSSRPAIITMMKHRDPGRTDTRPLPPVVISAIRPLANRIAANRVRPDRLTCSRARPRPQMKAADGAPRDKVPGCMITISGRKLTAMSTVTPRPGEGCWRAASPQEWQRPGANERSMAVPSAYTR